MSDSDTAVGRQRTDQDVIVPFPARAMAALRDRSPSSLANGSELPAGWHWLYFRSTPRRSHIGPDGHEHRGEFLPALQLPRRMWAGGDLRFHAPLRIGDEVERTSTIESVQEKEGRTGRLAFVKVRHQLSTSRGLAVDERQDLVYLTAPGRPGTNEPDLDTPDLEWSESVALDALDLFQFSAITYNGHRIHYDHRYATGTEGYPGIVVHGPLTALLLLGAVTRNGPGVPASFRYRAVSPLFADTTVRLGGTAVVAGAMQAVATGPDGAVAMRADARWEREVGADGAS